MKPMILSFLRTMAPGESSLYINLSSSEMDRTQLTDYVDRVFLDRFSLISGVSSVEVSGGLYKVMYVRLKPAEMAGRGVTTTDITTALNNENIESLVEKCEMTK